MAKILIVDDSPTELYIMKKAIEDSGHSVITAGNGQQGVDFATSEKPDLILMDVVMPEMNGFQATRKISRNPETANIPVIVVTTKDQPTDREWGIRQGASEYLVKPVDLKALVAMVNSKLAGKA
jgi:twitching motility two-component system response regulator PilH